jgi:hypothetical protein
VPFYIRAGKNLPITCTEVIGRFRKPPSVIRDSALSRNHLRFRISPQMTIAVGTTVMAQSADLRVENVEMVATRYASPDAMDAYERVLGDAMAGDATLFARQDYVEEAWRIVDPVLKAATPIYEYEIGTWGPSEVDQRVLPAEAGTIPWPPTTRTSALTKLRRERPMKFNSFDDADAVARAAAAAIAAEARAGGRRARALSHGCQWGPHSLDHAAGPGARRGALEERRSRAGGRTVAPPGHPDRNLVHLHDSLLQHTPLRAEQVHAMPVEWPDLDAAATEYARCCARSPARIGCSIWFTSVSVPTATRRLSCLETRSSMSSTGRAR